MSCGKQPLEVSAMQVRYQDFAAVWRELTDGGSQREAGFETASTPALSSGNTREIFGWSVNRFCLDQPWALISASPKEPKTARKLSK